MMRYATLCFLFLFACGTPVEECGNGVDDDENGLIDCLDSFCWGEECAEDCLTETDEDGDGDAGCADADCVTSLCEEDCSNGIDDDGDGNADCADSACFGDGCEEDCSTQLDEDGDGTAACEDSDCFGDSCDERCDTAGDEDADGAADCLDSDCWVPGGVCAEACDTETDEDGDGDVACADSDCFGDACVEDCATTADEDADGVSQCADSDCWGPSCVEVCDSPGDEDGDGLADCEDSDCAGDATCMETACNDAEDNDDDGLVDCADDDCWGNGCSAGVATLTGPLTVEALFSSEVFTTSTGASSSCTGVPISLVTERSRRFVWENVVGTVAYTGAEGDTANCEFNFDRAVLREVFGPDGLVSRRLGRTQPDFSPACTIVRPVGAFLPNLEFADDFNAVAVNGNPWLSVPTDIIANSFTSASTYAGSTTPYFTSCASRRQAYLGGGTADIAPAAGYIQAFYDGPDFCEENPASVGCSEAAASESCLTLRNDPAFAGIDGAYFIDPDGAGGEAPRLAFCDMTRDGGGWTLVVHNDDEGNWGDWNHDLKSVATVDGTYTAERVSIGDFYAFTDDLSGTEFLFETGDQQQWLITNTDVFDTTFESAAQDVRSDSTGAEDVEYIWLNRSANTEDPWVSIGDHVGDILYGEAGIAIHLTVKNAHQGANVFLR